MPTLADMLSQYNRILSLDDEELTDTEIRLKNNTLAELTDATTDKVDAIAEYLRSAKAQIKHWREESQRFANKARSAEAHVEYMKFLWLQSMQQNGLKDIKGNSYSMNRRTNKHVVISNPKALPAEYVRTKYEPDRAKLKEALEAGFVVKGATIEEKDCLMVR